jgi:hypothetical protein
MSSPRRPGSGTAKGLSVVERRMLLRQLAEVQAELEEMSERTRRIAGRVEAVRRAVTLGVVRG